MVCSAALGCAVYVCVADMREGRLGAHHLGTHTPKVVDSQVLHSHAGTASCQGEGFRALCMRRMPTSPCHVQGLCLDLKNLRMSPKLLARLAYSVAGKQDVRKVVGQLLPDLCQVWNPLQPPCQPPVLHRSCSS